MTEFENLKRSYISVVQWGLTARVGYHVPKQGNDVLHKFCESLIDNSNYNDSDKAMMKYDLQVIKESLSNELITFIKTDKLKYCIKK